MLGGEKEGTDVFFGGSEGAVYLDEFEGEVRAGDREIGI